MSHTLRISPITRIEGHLDIEVTVERVNGTLQVVEAASAGVMFRGFEIILKGRHPRDAVHYTQRVCGVCPVSHAMASCLALEDAFGLRAATNGRIVRNLVLGANYIQSHILHFYHLALADYLDTEGLLDMSPWKPRYKTRDMIKGQEAARFVEHYVQAIAMRRLAHHMGAIYAGKLPMATNFVPGGSSEIVHPGNVEQFRNLLSELRTFIDTVYLPDVQALADHFEPYGYYEIGRGAGNLLAYGVFDLNDAGTEKLLARGRATAEAVDPLDPGRIVEYVSHSYFSEASGNLNPAQGKTEPVPDKPGAYSWLKSPRYEDIVYEVGPLARMWINGDRRRGISVLDRLLARAHEAKKVADAMDGWLSELVPGEPVYTHGDMPQSASGIGLTEAPRGALGHWLTIGEGSIQRYQIVTPTAWNASPRDDAGNRGPLEQALLGTPVAELSQPVEILRVVHSMDPCLACAVHVLRAGRKPVRCFLKL